MFLKADYCADMKENPIQVCYKNKEVKVSKEIDESVTGKKTSNISNGDENLLSTDMITNYFEAKIGNICITNVTVNIYIHHQHHYDHQRNGE